MPLEARIYYPYHPYANRTFKVLQRAAGKSGQITVELSAGKTLTIPRWMIQPEAAQFQVGTQIFIPHTILLEIVDLLSANSAVLMRRLNALEHNDGST